MRARLLPSVLVALALSSAAVAVVPELTSSATKTAENTAATPATPVFSVRRVPGAISRTIANQRLATELDEVLAQSSLAGARDDTCLAVSDAEGRLVYARDDAKPLIPASTMKLVTASVALAKLGADSRYVTPVKAAAPPTPDGAVSDLWLVGSGDFLLATADVAAISGWLETPRLATPVEDLADRIVAAGVRRIGRILGDESRYDRQRYVPSWEAHYAEGDVGPQSALTVNSGYSQWRPFRIAATNPATNGANVLAEQLRSRGVTVGATGEGRAPEGAVTVAQIESAPLAEVVGTMVAHSDNLGAELLVKELGVRFGGAGTTAAGLGVLRTAAAELGFDVDPFAAADGSGLDRTDRLTCRLLQDVLTAGGAEGPLARGLPVAGRSGTLLRRFLGTAATGRVRAKTGSLSGVVGLSGFAQGQDGRSLAFSLVANDLPGEATGMALQERVANLLTTYPRAPAPDEIDPEPAAPK